MATLKDIMASDAADGGVFLPKDGSGNATGFNELVWFYPKGLFAKRVKINVVIEDYALRGTNESPGDGVVLNKDIGRQVRESLIVTMVNSVGVQREQSKEQADELEAREETWRAKRILGVDEHFTRVLFTRVKKATVRGNMRFG